MKYVFFLVSVLLFLSSITTAQQGEIGLSDSEVAKLKSAFSKSLYRNSNFSDSRSQFAISSVEFSGCRLEVDRFIRSRYEYWREPSFREDTDIVAAGNPTKVSQTNYLISLDLEKVDIDRISLANGYFRKTRVITLPVSESAGFVTVIEKPVFGSTKLDQRKQFTLIVKERAGELIKEQLVQLVRFCQSRR